MDKVDRIIRENNIKYLDQKNQEAYEKALAQFEKQQQREKMKAFTQNIKTANQKAVHNRKVKESQAALNKAKGKASRKQQITTDIQESQKQPEKQHLTQKQISEIQSAISNRAERYLQEKQLNEIDKRLQEERRKAKLHELNQKCLKLVSKSHRKVPPISPIVPQERKALLEAYTKQTEKEVEHLDNIIEGLIRRTNKDYHHSQSTDREKAAFRDKMPRKPQEKKPISIDDIFDPEFIEQLQTDNRNSRGFISSCDQKYRDSDSENEQNCRSQNDSESDMLFTKSASELLEMDYIPLEFDQK